MPYNSFFPSYYQPVQMPQSQNSGIVWVQGVEGAKAYPVASGNSVLLMDSEESVFYVKSSDVSGMPLPLRVFDYVERKDDKAPEVDLSAYVTKKELEETIEKLTDKKKKKKEEEDDDE